MNSKIRILVLVGVVLGILFGVPKASAVTSAWAPEVSYKIGDLVTYNGATYECILGHTSMVGWEPTVASSLWRLAAVSTTTNTPTATPTRTNTALAATPTRTATPTPTRTPTATPPGVACWAAWASSATYPGNSQASRNGQNYQAAFWNENQDPATHNGPAGSGQPWIPKGACGGTVTATPTPTRTVTGPTSTPTATTAVNGFPPQVSALYADISFTSIKASFQATGQKYYALAFVLGNNSTCVPAWDGTHLMSENYYAAEISAIRAGGGEVSAVFGGANGSDMASVCTTVSSLQAAFQAVINQYQFRWIDLNIEGGMVSDTVSLDRRNKAIAALQAANPNLKVSYTLPVLQSGLLQNALTLLSNAKSNGVRIDYVNVMTMNYGPAGIDMGQAAIDAATNTHNQLINLGILAKVGVTPMLGQNNTLGEIFDLGDADQLITFARANSYIGWLSFWSLGRDNGGCPGQTTASASCSGLTQSTYNFTGKFMAFP